MYFLQIEVCHVLKFKLQVHIKPKVWKSQNAIGTTIKNLANTLLGNMSKQFTRTLLLLKSRPSHPSTWQNKTALLAFLKQNWRELFLKMTAWYWDQENQKKKKAALKIEIFNKI